MSAEVTPESQDPKVSNKEFNFRAQEAKYQKMLEQERSARLELEKRVQEMASKTAEPEEESDDPYVDHKRLEKKLARFGERTKQETQGEIQKAVQTAIYEERKQSWLKNNPDFYDILQHADKFAAQDPELAETILEMPEGFERQKLVYKNIKALGLHMPAKNEPSIQDKIDANRRSPYYQPSGIANSPYTSQGDFSDNGKKQAFEKMKQLQKSLRLS